MIAPRNEAAMVAFGRVVRRRRQIVGLSMEGLAKASGLAAPYVMGIEHGKRNPSLCTMLRLSDGLGIALPEMLGGTDDLGADGLEAGRLLDELAPELRESVLAVLRALVVERRKGA
jgi:transcriptional regulator with XRE-family HTH domain